jgi:hypothetical protein
MGNIYLCKKCLQTRDVNYFQDKNEEKDFEIAEIELLGYKIIVVCIYMLYKAPDGNSEVN